MHLIKLCVGIDTVEQLVSRQAARLEAQRRAGKPQELVHRTRQMPRQRAKVLESGSLYWVIKGIVSARQRIIDLREETGEEGRTLCAIVLDHKLIATKPQPRRPFQGWRYLKPEDAPPDWSTAQGSASEELPEAMRAELAKLALI